MESYAPFIAPPERAPDIEPSKRKPRRNLFDVFKKRDEPTGHERLRPLEAPEQKHVERPPVQQVRPEHERFAATVMSLLRGEALRSPAAVESDYNGEAILTAERVTRPADSIEQTVEAAPTVAETLPFVERAKEMGRSVLRVLGRAKDEVYEADRRDHFTNPTNLEPLAAADADIRAAMEELVAPIEALQSPAQREPRDAIEAAVMSGGDHDPSVLFEPKTPLARTLEVAAAVASVTAREVLHAKERALMRTGVVRKVGVFALGAATVGGFVYTWNRLREVNREQRALRRERKRFETEVRENLAQEERRLHELEQTNVQGMTPPERRQYVEDVSEFAHKQAAEIRTVARARDIINQPQVQAEQTVPAYMRAVRQPEMSLSADLAMPERPAMQSEQAGGMVEHMAVTPGNSGHVLGGDAVTGEPPYDAAKLPQNTADPTHPVPGTVPSPPARRQSSQSWLWGFMLGVAVVIFIVLWGMRIL